MVKVNLKNITILQRSGLWTLTMSTWETLSKHLGIQVFHVFAWSIFKVFLANLGQSKQSNQRTTNANLFPVKNKKASVNPYTLKQSLQNGITFRAPQFTKFFMRILVRYFRKVFCWFDTKQSRVVDLFISQLFSQLKASTPRVSQIRLIDCSEGDGRGVIANTFCGIWLFCDVFFLWKSVWNVGDTCSWLNCLGPGDAWRYSVVGMNQNILE